MTNTRTPKQNSIALQDNSFKQRFSPLIALAVIALLLGVILISHEVVNAAPPCSGWAPVIPLRGEGYDQMIKRTTDGWEKVDLRDLRDDAIDRNRTALVNGPVDIQQVCT